VSSVLLLAAAVVGVIAANYWQMSIHQTITSEQSVEIGACLGWFRVKLLVIEQYGMV